MSNQNTASQKYRQFHLYHSSFTRMTVAEKKQYWENYKRMTGYVEPMPEKQNLDGVEGANEKK